MTTESRHRDSACSHEQSRRPGTTSSSWHRAVNGAGAEPPSAGCTAAARSRGPRSNGQTSQRSRSTRSICHPLPPCTPDASGPSVHLRTSWLPESTPGSTTATSCCIPGLSAPRSRPQSSTFRVSRSASVGVISRSSSPRRPWRAAPLPGPSTRPARRAPWSTSASRTCRSRRSVASVRRASRRSTNGGSTRPEPVSSSWSTTGVSTNSNPGPISPGWTKALPRSHLTGVGGDAPASGLADAVAQVLS